MRRHAAVMISVCFAASAYSQIAPLDNSSLRGAYFFRQLAMTGTKANTPAYALLGTITFDGAGGYTLTGQQTDTANAGAVQTKNISLTGGYGVGSGGSIGISSPIDKTVTMFGAFASGAVVANAHESNYFDIFVAIPVSSSSSNAALNGKYFLGSMEYLQGQAAMVRDAFAPITVNGSGGIADVALTGSAFNLGNATTTQSLTGLTYSLTSNGSGTLNFPASGTPAQRLVTGSKTLYVSADGNLFLGGAPGGFDIVLGVKALPNTAANSSYLGLYYLGSLETDASATGPNAAGYLSSYGGAINAFGNGVALEDLRINQEAVSQYDSTQDFGYTLGGDGSYATDINHVALGANGNVLMQVGNNNNYEIVLGLKAASFGPVNPGDVFLNPIGVQNNASSAPITNPIAPGEYIDLYGSNLSTTNATATAPFATSLGGTQVLLNGQPILVYYVTPTRVTALIPTNADFSQGGKLQVVNNGIASNTVSMNTANTSPGVFTIPAGGIGNGAILHADFSLVSASKPAKMGETVLVYLTGLGAVTPAVADNAVGPSNPLSKVVANLAVFVDGIQATVQGAFLAPGLSGVYQLNVTLPASGVSTGNVYLDVSTPDAYHSQAQIAVSR